MENKILTPETLSVNLISKDNYIFTDNIFNSLKNKLTLTDYMCNIDLIGNKKELIERKFDIICNSGMCLGMSLKVIIHSLNNLEYPSMVNGADEESIIYQMLYDEKDKFKFMIDFLFKKDLIFENIGLRGIYVKSKEDTFVLKKEDMDDGIYLIYLYNFNIFKSDSHAIVFIKKENNIKLFDPNYGLIDLENMDDFTSSNYNVNLSMIYKMEKM